MLRTDTRPLYEIHGDNGWNAVDHIAMMDTAFGPLPSRADRSSAFYPSNGDDDDDSSWDEPIRDIYRRHKGIRHGARGVFPSDDLARVANKDDPWSMEQLESLILGRPMCNARNGLTILTYGDYRFNDTSVWKVRDVWVPVGFCSQVVRDGIVFTLDTYRAFDAYGDDVLEYRVCAAEEEQLGLESFFDESTYGVRKLTSLLTEAVRVCIDRFPGLGRANARKNHWRRSGFKSAWKFFGLDSTIMQNQCKRQETHNTKRRREEERRNDEDNALQDRLALRLGWCPRDNPEMLGSPTKKRTVDIDLAGDGDE